ncbi:hypothetical protein [Amycolatopsis arida]|nr:hypothetical protein [Amycolatopsis arida]
MLWALISSEMVAGLLDERGWSREGLTQRLTALYEVTFVRPA